MFMCRCAILPRYRKGGIALTSLKQQINLSIMKVWKLAAILLFCGLGVVLIVRLKSPVKPGARSPVLSTVDQALVQPLRPVDLTRIYDNDPSFDAPGCWQAVPRGLQTLGNVPFQIGGLVQLWGEGPSGMARNYRERVDGLPVNGRFQTLYALHATSFTTVEGTPIAEVVFRYADGSFATNSILYGTDSRDFWQPLSEHTPLPTNSPSKIVWRGDHLSLPDWVKCLRLFAMAIPNPKPDSDVTSVDLVSTKSRVTWIVLALTTGPAGALKPDLKLEEENTTAVQETTMILSARDKDNGHPVADVRFQVTLLTGRRPKPYGSFTPNQDGEAIVDLPPERIKLLSVQTISGNYAPVEMSWSQDRGERIPTNYVFKLSKAPRP
jgi:hypothetical protein